MAFADRLAAAIERAGTPACIGLDPVLERLPSDVSGVEPADRICAFCGDIIESIVGTVAIIKPQSACFERYGPPGLEALEAVCALARDAGMLVILDVKRADIGVTAGHYAAAALGSGAQAVTLSPYMGRSSIEPFLDAGLGAFVLARTSNPDSDELQALTTGDGETLAERTAEMIRELGARRLGLRGLSDVGAVVGITKSEAAERLREHMPRAPFLVPGFGAQGGSFDSVRPLLGERSLPGRGVIPTASRSITYPDINFDWREAVREQAKIFADQAASAVA
ncbi:MAG: orotidine-5'-phosphate decarboxylase [Planctomycetota bacterium]